MPFAIYGADGIKFRSNPDFNGETVGTDDVTIFAQLNSWQFTGLYHVLGVISPVMRAQVSAARCFDELTQPNPCVVDARQLELPSGAHVALQDWPLQDESVFGLVQRKQLTDHVFRPREIMDEMTFARQRLYHPIEPFTKVVDSICITVTQGTGLWTMFTFLRCGHEPYFTDEHFQAAERYQPAIRNALMHNNQAPTRQAENAANKTQQTKRRRIFTVQPCRFRQAIYLPNSHAPNVACLRCFAPMRRKRKSPTACTAHPIPFMCMSKTSTANSASDHASNCRISLAVRDYSAFTLI